MDRRAFLGMFAAAIAGAAFDPERALWTPGKKLISIPKPQPTGIVALAECFKVGDIIEIGRWPEKYIVTAVYEHEGRVGLMQERMSMGQSYSAGSLFITEGLDRRLVAKNFIRFSTA